jgi:hypothetical protein
MSWNRDVELHGHPLALRLARQELEGSADQWLSAADWGDASSATRQPSAPLGSW